MQFSFGFQVTQRNSRSGNSLTDTNVIAIVNKKPWTAPCYLTNELVPLNGRIVTVSSQLSVVWWIIIPPWCHCRQSNWIRCRFYYCHCCCFCPTEMLHRAESKFVSIWNIKRQFILQKSLYSNNCKAVAINLRTHYNQQTRPDSNFHTPQKRQTDTLIQVSVKMLWSTCVHRNSQLS